MEEEKPIFEILRVVEWNYVRSRLLGASQKPEKDSPRAIAVKCNRCSARFEARESNSGRKGTFLGTLGGMQIICAKCGTEDTVRNPEA